MLEVYSSLTQQNPSFLWDMFHEKDNNYNLRSKNLLMLPQTKTTTYGNDSLSFRGSISWNSLPNDTKITASVCSFKSCIEKWIGETCRCKGILGYFRFLSWTVIYFVFVNSWSLLVLEVELFLITNFKECYNNNNNKNIYLYFKHRNWIWWHARNPRKANQTIVMHACHPSAFKT